MAQFMLNTLTLSNINRFSKFFHCQNQEKICNKLSQGSAATHLRCGGIFSDNVITKFLLILTVKEFRKSVNI